MVPMTTTTVMMRMILMMMITQDLTLALIEYLAAICGGGNQQSRNSVWVTIEMWARVINSGRADAMGWALHQVSTDVN